MAQAIWAKASVSMARYTPDKRTANQPKSTAKAAIESFMGSSLNSAFRHALEEKKLILRMLGAEVWATPDDLCPVDHPKDGAIALAHSFVRSEATEPPAILTPGANEQAIEAREPFVIVKSAAVIVVPSSDSLPDSVNWIDEPLVGSAWPLACASVSVGAIEFRVVEDRDTIRLRLLRAEHELIREILLHFTHPGGKDRIAQALLHGKLAFPLRIVGDDRDGLFQHSPVKSLGGENLTNLFPLASGNFVDVSLFHLTKPFDDLLI